MPMFFLVISLELNNRRHSLPKSELESISSPLYASVYLKSCCYSLLSWIVVNLTCFPMDIILGILPVKASTLSVHLRIYLCALINTNNGRIDVEIF